MIKLALINNLTNCATSPHQTNGNLGMFFMWMDFFFKYFTCHTWFHIAYLEFVWYHWLASEEHSLFGFSKFICVSVHPFGSNFGLIEATFRIRVLQASKKIKFKLLFWNVLVFRFDEISYRVLQHPPIQQGTNHFFDSNYFFILANDSVSNHLL